MGKITLKLNGKDLEIEDSATVSELLDVTGIKSKMFVVEKNQKIVNKEDYDTCVLAEGDEIEVVGFFGGG